MRHQHISLAAFLLLIISTSSSTTTATTSPLVTDPTTSTTITKRNLKTTTTTLNNNKNQRNLQLDEDETDQDEIESLNFLRRRRKNDNNGGFLHDHFSRWFSHEAMETKWSSRNKGSLQKQTVFKESDGTPHGIDSTTTNSAVGVTLNDNDNEESDEQEQQDEQFVTNSQPSRLNSLLSLFDSTGLGEEISSTAAVPRPQVQEEAQAHDEVMVQEEFLQVQSEGNQEQNDPTQDEQDEEDKSSEEPDEDIFGSYFPDTAPKYLPNICAGSTASAAETCFLMPGCDRITQESQDAGVQCYKTCSTDDDCRGKPGQTCHYFVTGCEDALYPKNPPPQGQQQQQQQTTATGYLTHDMP